MRTLVCFAACLAACGGSVQSPGNPESDTGATVAETGAEDTAPVVVDAAPEAPPRDHGAPSETYPAFTPDMPMLFDNGGATLKAASIVTVTFGADPNASSYESFGDKLGGTDYWKQITAEYGIGPTVPGGHVRETAVLPSAMSDSELDAFIAEHARDYVKYGWPKPTDQSLYVLYVPKTTAVTLSGKEACSSGVGGFHTSTFAGDLEIAYAIVLQCSFGSKATTPRTVSSSHEIGEAATDAHPQTGTPGWRGVDPDHSVWHLFMVGNVENADLCEIYREQRYTDTVDADFAFNLQRQWSNVSAKAGHNPCVPAPTSQPYFNVVPLDQEKITWNGLSIGAGGKAPTRGYHVAVGETKTFAVGLYSDGAMGEWTLRVGEGTAFPTTPAPPKRLTTSIDLTSGKNGQKAWVTVTVNAIPASKANTLVVVSRDASGTEHYMPIMISSQ